jgi:hypothetical protein
MILNANDFGCVPDGRFLERARIDEGSTSLTDLDGSLRPTDVGKNIAIPGAADLETKIAALIEQGAVEDVVMGGPGMEPNQLTGSLFNPGNPNPVPFKPEVHEGLRITVAGAGSGGPLLTNITKVLGDTLIELEHDFQTPVTDSTAILNREDRIALDDYARRSVENVTVDLGDRIITDAQMIVGGRALFSQTAKFSSLDLDKRVTIKEAGVHVTTIASFQNNTKVTLAVPAPRKVDKQQADVWMTDSRPGFELLLASLESLETESAEICFGPGVYDFKRSSTSGPTDGVIGLFAKKNLALRGAGPGVTILRLMPQQDLANTHVIETRECKHLTFHDFSVHGAYLTMDKTNEQMHAIFFNEGSEDIVVERVRIFQSAGDGIRFLGRAENLDTGAPEIKVRNVRVENCQLIQNKRSGIAFQREVAFVSVRNCYIEMTSPSSDSCIDLEPTGNQKPGKIFVAPTDLLIESNIMKHGTIAPAVSISGFGGPDPACRIKFSNNELIGGHIFCTDVTELTIQNNTIRVTPVSSPLGKPPRTPINMAVGGDSVVITGNLVVNEDPFTRSAIFLGGKRKVLRALVANNLCFAEAGNGIECLSGDDVVISNNLIVATKPCNNGILVRSQSSAMDGVSVRDNDITIQGSGKWQNGIHFSANPEPMIHISIISNSVRGADKGILFQHFQHEDYPPRLVCALNRVAEDVDVPFDELLNLPFDILTGGLTSKGVSGLKPGAGRFMVGRENPENRVVGNIGDIFQRLDGGIGETLYVKEENVNPNTGWKAK